MYDDVKKQGKGEDGDEEGDAAPSELEDTEEEEEDPPLLDLDEEDA